MTLTITTWNVQNFTRGKSNYQQKLGQVREVLQSLNSDVIALQEILDDDALYDLANGLDFVPTLAGPNSRGNRVAFLTRKPPKSSQEISLWQLPSGVGVHRHNSNHDVVVLQQWSRPALRITYDYNGREIDFISVHLKSKLLTYPNKGKNSLSTSDESVRASTAYFALGRRAAEATTLREHVTKLLTSNQNVVLLGDLNDGPQSATTQILYGPPGSQPCGPSDRNNKNCAFQRRDKNDPQRLFNVTTLSPAQECWSRCHNGANELLDHILMSEGMLNPIKNGLRTLPEIHIRNSTTPSIAGEHPIDEDLEPDHAAVTARFL